MEQFKDDTVIEVEAEQVDLIDSADSESIDERWYSATQVQRILDLNKSELQKAIAKLTSLYEIDLKILRRGGARATEYSQIALNAIELMKAGKFAKLRNLVEVMPTAPTIETSTAIVFLDRHREIARTAASVADSNLTQIAASKFGLLNNYRELGRALGKQAAAEVRLGFTEEVKTALENLRES